MRDSVHGERRWYRMRSVLLGHVHSVEAGHRCGDACLADNAVSNAGRAIISSCGPVTQQDSD